MNIILTTPEDLEKIIRQAIPAAQTPDETLTLKEAAAFLKLSDRTVAELAKRGEIPCRNVGRGQDKFLFSRNKLSEWLAGR